jgi:2-hydroxycyclohexanecarboxyl-CoA dehydrogenase
MTNTSAFIGRVAGKVAIVTGGSDGLGRGIAAKLAAERAKVVICGRSAEKGEAVAKEMRGAGGDVSFVTGDVFNADDMAALAESVIARHGQIDICIASGGGSHYAAPGDGINAMGYFHEINPADVAALVARATLAKLQPVHAVVHTMIAQRSGSILFITSEGGRFPTPGQTAVSLYAGGLIAMTKVVAKELSRHAIRVNALAVTLVRDTPAWRYAYDNPDYDPVIQDKILAKAPFGLATPADIADVASYLVSDEARFITGSTVSATGGLTYN